MSFTLDAWQLLLVILLAIGMDRLVSLVWREAEHAVGEWLAYRDLVKRLGRDGAREYRKLV